MSSEPSHAHVAAHVAALVEARIRRLESQSLPANLGQLLEEAAEQVGDQPLWHFIESGETETYTSALRRINGLAAALLRTGITKGMHVAVMLPNIAAFPLTWLALARIGAVMVPVNVNYRERELAYVINDSEARFLVVHASVLPGALAARTHGLFDIADHCLITVGDDGHRPSDALRWEDLAAEPLDRFESPAAVEADDLLNIQYTSGTTGFPKGCMLTHKYWIISGKVNAFRDGLEYRRILASTPFFYMDPQWLLLMTIYQRATIYIAARQSTSRFVSWLRDYQISFCLFPWILAKMPETPFDRQDSVVRANVYGVAGHLHRGLERRFGLRAREAFGMTEIGPALFMPIEADDMVGSGSCGRAGPFRACRLVDDEGREVETGEIGELWVRGEGLMLGYYNNPEATRAAFKDGWLRTGDLFRRDADGYFYIVGRSKDMIRRSGENIAAREVESVLNALDDVQESAVVPVPDDARGEEVMACIHLREGIAPSDETIARLISHCGNELAPFKVPRFFAFRSSLPRTASMKIAKHKIVLPGGQHKSGSYDRVERRWLD